MLCGSRCREPTLTRRRPEVLGVAITAEVRQWPPGCLHNRAMTINWAYFPRSEKASELSRGIVRCFEAQQEEVSSAANNDLIGDEYKDAASNVVLQKIRPGLLELGFKVEASKAAADRIRIPVLFGMRGEPAMSFEADAYHEQERYVVEIEAGRAVTNYQFLKDLFQACVMVDVDFLCIAVRTVYRKSEDFRRVYNFFDTLYTSGRMKLPLKGILIVGY